MPARRVARVETVLGQQARLSGRERHDADPRFVERRPARDPDREERRLAARQDLHPAVAALPGRAVRCRERHGRPAVRRDARETREVAGREHDRVVRAEAAAASVRSVAQGERRTTADRHLLELPGGQEADPFAVRREEGRVGALGAGKRRGFQLVQGTRVELPDAGRAPEVHEARPVRREGQGRAPAEKQGLALGERRDESHHGPRRLLARAAEPVGAEARREREERRQSRQRGPRRSAAPSARDRRVRLGPAGCDEAQLALQVVRALPALVRVLGQAGRHHAVEARRDEWRERRDRLRVRAQDRRDHARLALAGERPLSSQHLVEHEAERPDVRAGVRLAALELLGRHVLERPDERAFLRERLLLRL